MLAYKAETDSLRAAVESAQKAEKVKERAMQRRFEALEKALASMENTAKAWKQRALAVEDMLKGVSHFVQKTKGLWVLGAKTSYCLFAPLRILCSMIFL